MNKSNWTTDQIVQFLKYLPFSQQVWKWASSWLGQCEQKYWYSVRVNPYSSDGDVAFAVDKLIEYGRPHAAINCLHYALEDKALLDKTRSIKALLAAASSTESSNDMDTNHICAIIEALQNDVDTDTDDLFQVEWAYLPLLDDYYGASPKSLENRLATNSEFFCEVIRLVYRSTKEDEPQREPSEQEIAIATNAYRLLQKWRTPPGTQPGGSFSGDQFTKWLNQTKETCAESGHLDPALSYIGKVLFYCPPDPQGLWIDQAAANALNAKDAEKMRISFSSAIFYPGGTRSVDPTGEVQQQLAQKYRQQAEDVENRGYQRLASTLRVLAKNYDLDAERNIADHKR